MTWIALVFTAVLANGPAARANTDELVTSIHHGGTPYLVVTADAAGGSRRAPGLYGRVLNGWRPILEGRLLQDAEKGVWFQQLKLSQKDTLYHGLVIVDGRLTLINLKADPARPESMLTIGSSQTPLVEGITGQKRLLPPITSVDDVSFQAYERGFDQHDHQLIVMSVRCASCGGNGLTFAFAVKAQPDPARGYELVGQPWVLDYEFHPATHLNSFVEYDEVARAYLLRSATATDFLLNSDFSSFGGFAGTIETDLKRRLRSTSLIPSASIQLKNGRLEAGLLKPRKYTRGSFGFSQEFDLRTQTGQLKFKYLANIEATLPGFLDVFERDPEKPAIWIDQGDHALFQVEGRLYFARPGQNSQLSVVELGQSHLKADEPGSHDLSFRLLDRPSENGPAQRLLLISTRGGSGRGRTQAFRLTFYPNGVITHENDFVLTDHFLSTSMLEKRIHATDHKMLFDHHTGPVNSIEEYHQAFDSTHPVIDLENSSSMGLAYQIRDPIEVVHDAEGCSTSYRIYRKSKLLNDPTGLYTTFLNQTIGSVGQILDPREKAQLKTLPVLFHARAVRLENNGATDIHAFAQDASFNGGATTFKVTLALNGSGGTRLVEIPVQAPFRELQSLRVVPGRREFGDTLAVIATFTGRENGETTHRVSTYSFKVTKVGVTPGSWKVMTKVGVEPSRLHERLVYDEHGRLYFILDPAVPKDERRLEVFDVFDQRPIKPNTEKNIKIMWDSNPGADESGLTGDRRTAWWLTPGELERRQNANARSVEDANADYLWGKLFVLLDRLAETRTSDKLQVLLVPTEMKKYVNELILNRYMRRAAERNSPFHHVNRNLRLFQIESGHTHTQDEVLENLDVLNKMGSTSNLILADMATINANARPALGESKFQLKHVTGVNQTGFGEDTDAKEETQTPHLLYLLAAGKPVEPAELAAHPNHGYTTLITATPQEWASAQTSAQAEFEVGLDQRIEVTEFPLPTPEDQARLLGQVLEDRNIRPLRYSFNAQGIARNLEDTPEAHAQKLLDYAVTRVASEAENARQNGLNAFIDFRAKFVHGLLKDRTVLRERVINKAFIERTLTSVFDIPVNLESLPPDDPIFILSRRDAIRQLNDRGVVGPFSIKARLIKGMLSVLRFDPTRTISSSHIVIGESGSGKTRLIEGVLDWLFPIKYDFRAADKNQDAQSIRINVGKMVENKRDGDQGDQLTFEEVRDHINNFLRFGFRGAIFLDDFHAAPEAVRTQLLTLVRTLFETKGLYTAASKQGTARVPLRHLHLFIALNPADTTKVVDALPKTTVPKPTTFEDVLLASLSTKDFKVETSLLKRFGVYHNMTKFPHGAKGPVLSRDTLITARDIMLRKQKLVVNTLGSIRSVADAFPNADARTFLSTAASALVDQIDPRLYPKGSLFMVVPGRRRMYGGGSDDLLDDTEANRIEQHVQKNTKVLPISESVTESQLHFIAMLLQNFRSPLLEQLVIALEDDPRFAESIDNQRSFLLPTMMAMRNHLQRREVIPLSELDLDPSLFGLTSSGDRALFHEQMREAGAFGQSYFPFPIQRTQGFDNLDVLLTGRTGGSQHTRPALLTAYYQKMLDLLERYAKRFYYLDSLEGPPPPERWLRELPAQASEAALKPYVEELRDLLWRFLRDANDPALAERLGGSVPPLTPYAIAHTFLFVLDKAITQLPWIRINKHLIGALESVVEDQVLGQSPAIKSYLFDYKYSPIRAASNELIFQLIESSQLKNEYPERSQQEIHEDYVENCERLLGAS